MDNIPINILNTRNYFNNFPPTRDRIMPITYMNDHMNQMFNQYFTSVEESHFNFRHNSYLCKL